MKLHTFRFNHVMAVFSGLALVCSTSFAAKPEWAGNGNGKKPKEERAAEVKVGAYFGDQQRTVAADYYGKQQASGRCPPGLAKNNNGCMPPGQAKNWALGQVLPKTLVVYPVPREVVVKIGVPPAGYKYVRVANDILLIAIGSQMVVDAIEDLMRP